MDWIYSPEAWIALVTLTLLEVVLGIDNIIFISILTEQLPVAQRPRARTIGLLVAMISRILLLFSLNAMMKLTKPLIAVASYELSGRDLILLAGGLFLLYKATHEIHNAVEGDADQERAATASQFSQVIVQILILDIVFSIDSVITAVGMANDIAVMVIAVVIAVGVMIVAINPISEFVQQHPTVKMLALSFLMLIGVTLVADGLGFHVPKGYIYFAIAFSMFVEFLNLRAAKGRARGV
jgi:predicted tellurium resistance membrane protein TerC